MKLNIKELLEYFDLYKATNYGDATAAISVVGEDLGAALFKHYRESSLRSKVKIIDANKEIPTTGRRIGSRLDRWILEDINGDQTLFQTEIKSWCSRSLGGLNVPVDISQSDLLDKINKNWERDVLEFNDSEKNGLNKVLIKMNKREGDVIGQFKQEPLLIFWDVRNPNNQIDCFNKYKVKDKHFDFDYCWIFSCSLYLRNLYLEGITDIDIDMPNAERRLTDLFRIFKL